jgi:hypothetical protein
MENGDYPAFPGCSDKMKKGLLLRGMPPNAEDDDKPKEKDGADPGEKSAFGGLDHLNSVDRSVDMDLGSVHVGVDIVSHLNLDIELLTHGLSTGNLLADHHTELVQLSDDVVELVFRLLLVRARH